MAKFWYIHASYGMRAVDFFFKLQEKNNSNLI